MTFDDICRFRRPIVHFRIDIEGIIAAPWRPDLIVPNPLQIGWLCSRPRTGNQEITAILEQEGDQLKVTVGLEIDDAFIHGLLHGVSCAQPQRNAAELGLVVGQMDLSKRIVGFLSRGLQLPGRLADRIFSRQPRRFVVAIET